MLCLFALFVSQFEFIGPEKSHWESGQLKIFMDLIVCLFIILLIYFFISLFVYALTG